MTSPNPKASRACGHCGGEFLTGKSLQRFCRDECRRLAALAQLRAATATRPSHTTQGACEECGAPFWRHKNGPQRRFCSDRCYRVSRRPSERTCECRDCGATFTEPVVRGRRATIPYCPAHRGRESQQAHSHGLTTDQLRTMKRSQDGRCLGCLKRKPLVIDHDHTCCPGTHSCGQCVRGLLCRDCNAAQGLAGEDPATLERLADNMRRYRDQRRGHLFAV